jgi:hypothetical protein
MTTADDPRAALAAAEQQLAEAERLDRLADAQASQVAEAERDVAEARRLLGQEAADVERLERASFARVWASLRGDMSARVDRERAEAEAARYRHDVASDRLRAAQDALRATHARRADLGDAAARRERAQRDVQEWLLRHDGPEAATLSDVLRRYALLDSERVQVEEAAAAAVAALGPLKEALRLLEQAGGWAAYDTFFDSGILTDLAKRDRMEQASEQLRLADRALRHLSAELADIGRRASFDLALDDGLGTFDLWFDDIFSSWAVRNRIQDARARVAEALDAVGGIAHRLHQQARDVAAELVSAEARRAAILRG